MTKMEMAITALTILGGCGLIMIILAFIAKMLEKRKFQLATEIVDGKIIRYGYPGDGRIYPVVQYNVNGNNYKIKKKFRGVKLIEALGKKVEINERAFEDEDGWLNINLGKKLDSISLGQDTWPKNTKIAVHYNPKKPRMSYVERPDKSTAPKAFIMAGIILIIIGCLMFYFIRV